MYHGGLTMPIRIDEQTSKTCNENNSTKQTMSFNLVERLLQTALTIVHKQTNTYLNKLTVNYTWNMHSLNDQLPHTRVPGSSFYRYIVANLLPT